MVVANAKTKNVPLHHQDLERRSDEIKFLRLVEKKSQQSIKKDLGQWVFPKIMVPQNGWFIMDENPINMDDCHFFGYNKNR